MIAIKSSGIVGICVALTCFANYLYSDENTHPTVQEFIRTGNPLIVEGMVHSISEKEEIEIKSRLRKETYFTGKLSVHKVLFSGPSLENDHIGLYLKATSNDPASMLIDFFSLSENRNEIVISENLNIFIMRYSPLVGSFEILPILQTQDAGFLKKAVASKRGSGVGEYLK